MISKKEIIEKLTSHLNNDSGIDDIIEIIDRETIEKDYYWVFFYNTKKFLETNNLSYALAGNAPIIVNKATGAFYETGTAQPIEFYMREYENQIGS